MEGKNQSGWFLSLRRRLAATGLVFIGLIMIGTIAIVYVLPGFNAPTQGHIVTPRPVRDGQPAYKQLVTPYYSLRYSSAYQLLPKPEHSASLDAQILAGRQEGGIGVSSRMVLTIVELSPGGVTEDSSYMLYKSRPDTYALRQETIGGDTVVIATKKDGDYEKAYLWPHGKYLLTVTLLTGAESPVIEEEMNRMLRELRWADNL